MTEEYPLRITENFVLPVWIGCAKITDYERKEETYTEQEARKEALRRLQQYEKKLLKNHIEITENRVTTSVTRESCITKGVLQITEQIGRESKIKKENETQS